MCLCRSVKSAHVLSLCLRGIPVTAPESKQPRFARLAVKSRMYARPACSIWSSVCLAQKSNFLRILFSVSLYFDCLTLYRSADPGARHRAECTRNCPIFGRQQGIFCSKHGKAVCTHRRHSGTIILPLFLTFPFILFTFASCGWGVQ